MANKKITDLTELTKAASDDYLEIVDTSANASKKITRENLIGFAGTWQSYTVSWTAATTNPSIGNGTLAGRYVQIGKTVIGVIKLVMGSTTTYGSGAWSFSLPYAVKNSYSLGQWASYGAGAVYNTGHSILYPNTGVVSSFIRDSGVSYLNATTPHTWASGSELHFFATYETA